MRTKRLKWSSSAPHFTQKSSFSFEEAAWEGWGKKGGEEKEELGENIKIYVDLNVGSSGKYTNILV